MQKSRKKLKKVQEKLDRKYCSANNGINTNLYPVPLGTSNSCIDSLLLKLWDLCVEESMFKTPKTKADKFILYISKHLYDF